uniref:Uncharacterized protein n=1 Tax=Arundo donax TaxID=35708 RepID=A0A0A9AFY4_ARUDO
MLSAMHTCTGARGATTYTGQEKCVSRCPSSVELPMLLYSTGCIQKR